MIQQEDSELYFSLPGLKGYTGELFAAIWATISLVES